MPPTVDLFEKMLLPHLGAAYNLARWLTHNAHDAEDVVQESYLKALRSFHTFRVEADGRAWLLKVVRNTFYTWLRNSVDPRAANKCIRPTLNAGNRPKSTALSTATPTMNASTLTSRMV